MLFFDAVILAFLRLHDGIAGFILLTEYMKSIVYIPFALVTGIISSSCGSSVKDEPLSGGSAINPPVLNFPVTLEKEPVGYSQVAIPIESAIPVATVVAGRPGFVFNPYNQNMVEVNGISSGTKVRDPQDSDPSHVFLVP